MAVSKTTIVKIDPKTKKVWVTGISYCQLEDFKSNGWKVFYGSDPNKETPIEVANMSNLQGRSSSTLTRDLRHLFKRNRI